MPTDYEPPILLRYSPLYNKLELQRLYNKLELQSQSNQQEGLPLFFVLKDNISTKDAIETIKIFDFEKKFLEEQIIFLENTSGNHWDVYEKNKGDYNLNTINLAKELDTIPYHTFFTALEKFQDTRENEFQTISTESNWSKYVNCNRHLKRCFENNKTREFHVRTLFCNYLSENLLEKKSLATLDLDDLILNSFGNGFNELKFNKTDKFDFKYLFPVDETDLNKVKTFYCDGEYGGEQMITKVVKILDKYFEDLEKEKNIQEKDMKTFIIVEKAIDQIIQVQLNSKVEAGKDNKDNATFIGNSDSSFEEEDYTRIGEFKEKCLNFREKYRSSLENIRSRSQNDGINKDGILKPVEDFFGAVEGIFQNLLGNSSDKARKNDLSSEGAKIQKIKEQIHEDNNKKPSNILGGIIDAIAVFCGSQKEKEEGKGGSR